MDPLRRPRIVTLGDLIVDVVALARSGLAHASDTPGRVVIRQGGSAANTAREVVRAGGEAAFIGAVGRDDWGRRLADALADAGVRAHLVAKGAPTARIVALVEPGGERTFVTDRGAADLLMPGDLRRDWFAGAAALHLPGYSLYHEPLQLAAGRAVVLAREAGAVISVDLASSEPIRSLGPATVVTRVAAQQPDVLFANVAEARAVLGERPTSDLLEIAPLVVVKDGQRGCEVHLAPSRGGAPRSFGVPARALAALDTTGAGDAFAAGFLVRWLAARPGRRRHPATVRAAAAAGHRAAARRLRAAAREPELR